MSNLVFAGILFVISLFVKRSAFPLLVIVLSVFVFYLFGKKKIPIFIKIVSIIASCLVIFLLANKVVTLAMDISLYGFNIFPNAKYVIPGYSDYAIPLNLNNLVHLIGLRLFTYADWHLLFAVFLFVSIFFFKQIWKTNLKYLWMICISNHLMIFYVFSRASYWENLVDGSMIQRLVLHFAPDIVLFIALVYKEVNKKNENAG